MKKTIITVGREYGSGGRLIARKLAEELGYAFYDRELIELAARESGLAAEFISQAEARRTSSLLYDLYFNAYHVPIGDQVFIIQSNLIRKLADEGPCVFVGRCANYVLRGREDCLNLFVHAPLEQRINRAVKDYGIAENGAKEYVIKQDKSRASYYNYFTSGKWGVARDYHLCIDSSLGIDRVVDGVAGFCR